MTGRRSTCRVTSKGWLLLALAGALLASAAWAGDLYKWQDEDGIWHFSDRPPDDAESTEVEVSVFERDPTSAVTMQQTGSRTEPGYEFHNGLSGPVEIEIELTEAVNVVSEPPLPARFILQGQQRRKLVRFRSAEAGQRTRFRLRYDWTPGVPIGELPTDTALPAPFPAGQSYLVSQASGGTTHNDAANRHAVDLAMPEGAPVLAVKAGLVMEAEDGYQGGGTDMEKYVHRANRVLLVHDDGRMTLYAHLEPGSVTVRAGDRVRRGQLIGRSGNTGFSSGPHLHFAWQQNIGMELVSIPFVFRQPAGHTSPPEPGLEVTGTLPAP